MKFKNALFVAFNCMAAYFNSSADAQSNKPLQYEKSLSPADPSTKKIWSEDEIQTPISSPDGTKSLETVANPVIQDYVIKVPDGKIVVSQLWDASCGTKLCPTKIYLEKLDGSRQILNDGDMMPQFQIEKEGNAYKSLDGANPQVTLSSDMKSIDFKTSDNQVQKFDLNPGGK